MNRNARPDLARVVVQFKPPEKCRARIIEIQEELRKIDPFQEYKEPDDFHISVTSFTFAKRLSDFSMYENLVERFRRIAYEFSPFQVSIIGLYSFPTAIYSEAKDSPSGNFQAVKQRIDDELRKEKFVEPIVAGKAYIPHLTLAMFKTNDVSTLLKSINSESLKNSDFGNGTINELEVKEINVYNLPNRTLSGKLAYLRKKFVDTRKGSEKFAKKTRLDFTRKSA